MTIAGPETFKRKYARVAAQHGLMPWDELKGTYRIRNETREIAELQGYWLSNDTGNLNIALMKGAEFGLWDPNRSVLEALPHGAKVYVPAEGRMTVPELMEWLGLD